MCTLLFNVSFHVPFQHFQMICSYVHQKKKRNSAGETGRCCRYVFYHIALIMWGSKISPNLRHCLSLHVFLNFSSVLEILWLTFSKKVGHGKRYFVISCAFSGKPLCLSDCPWVWARSKGVTVEQLMRCHDIQVSEVKVWRSCGCPVK